MGDMSELRTLTVIGVFTASLIFLLVNIPTGLLPTQTSFSTARNVQYLDYWDATTWNDYADINTTRVDPDLTWARWDDLPDYAWANMFSQRIDDGDADATIDFGGYEELWLLSRYTLNNSEGRIYIAFPLQRFLGFGWVTKWGYVDWYFNNGTSITHNSGAYGDGRFLTKFILEDYWEEPLDENNPSGGQQNQTSFIVQMHFEEQQPVKFDVHFSFNSTAYGDPQFAWDSNTGNPVPDDLYLLMGINFNQERTTYDSYSLISALLFFNLPQLLTGVPSFVGYLLSIMVWIPMIYVAFILLLRAVGGLFGGGA
jgi:hypothetical protein